MAEIFNFSPIEEKTSYRSLSYKKFHKRQNARKVRYNLFHFREYCEKVINEVTETKTFNFFSLYQKTRFFKICARVYRPSSSTFVFYEIFYVFN